MVTVLPPPLTEEEKALRQALIDSGRFDRPRPELEPKPKRKPRILPDLRQQPPDDDR